MLASITASSESLERIGGTGTLGVVGGASWLVALEEPRALSIHAAIPRSTSTPHPKCREAFQGSAEGSSAQLRISS